MHVKFELHKKYGADDIQARGIKVTIADNQYGGDHEFTANIPMDVAIEAFKGYAEALDTYRRAFRKEFEAAAFTDELEALHGERVQMEANEG